MNKRVTFVSPFSDDSKVEIEMDFCQCELVSVGAAKYCPTHDVPPEFDKIFQDNFWDIIANGAGHADRSGNG